MMLLPLAIGGVCIITSIIGTFFVKLGASQSIMGALYKGLIVTGVLSLIGDLAGDDQLAGRLGAARTVARQVDHRHGAVRLRHRRPRRHRR
jgi:Na+/H+-translocating membrane pyrophosphatase